MKYLRDRYGVIWGIVLFIGIGLLASHISVWTTGIGGLMAGLAYGSLWSRSINA